MKRNIHSYESNKVTVTYDVKRCIHARECVKGLKEVFDPQKRPWIQPDQAPADDVMDVIERCPTGALHYEHKQAQRQEVAPPVNTFRLIKDGPVYIHGNIELQDEEGNTLLQDTRVALCRCGHSENKPLCDNSHKEINFRTSSSFDSSSLEARDADPPSDNSSSLILKALKNGPISVRGNYHMLSPAGETIHSSKNIALCRCGGSGNKPFCDGTHKKVGFESR